MSFYLHLDYFQIKYGDLCEEQGKCFHRYIAAMGGDRYQAP